MILKGQVLYYKLLPRTIHDKIICNHREIKKPKNI